MPDEASKVTVEGPGIQVSRGVDESQLLAIMRILLSSEPIAGPVPTVPPVSQRTSLSEFFRQVSPKRYPDKIVTIAYYLQAKLAQASFTTDEIKPQFKHVGEPAPANFSRDVRWAIKNGWLARDSEDPGRYYVTGAGIRAVESGFPEDVTKATGFESPGRSRRRRRRRTADGPPSSE